MCRETAYATTKVIHDASKAAEQGREDARAGRKFDMSRLPCDCLDCIAAYVDSYNQTYIALHPRTT